MQDHMRHLIEKISTDDQVLTEFHALCDCGGRRCGDPGEAVARERLSSWMNALAKLAGGSHWSEALPYPGWHPLSARIRTPNGPSLEVQALLRSGATPAGGLTARVLDLGRGTPEDFAAAADRIEGAIVIVRHEYMFAPDHIHRSVKYEMARKARAAAFLIAAEAIVAGDSGDGCPGIPAASVDEATARLLADAGSATLEIAIRSEAAQTENLVLDLPGETTGRVVLSAHIDGHARGESALDNASGLAACLCAARALASMPRRRALRVMFFSLEEWGLEGSRRHLARLDDAARQEIVLNVNLDTVAGSDRLTALTSEFAELEPLMQQVSRIAGTEIRCFAPMRANSDHYNFAIAGIPAFRLVAGFEEPDANTRHLLTAADTRDKASLAQLKHAAKVAAITCHLALNRD